MTTIALIIPVLNHEERLENVLSDISAKLPQLNPEILVVYDITKPDMLRDIYAEQADLVDRYGIRTLTRLKERGFGSALRAGVSEVKSEVIVPIMGDCSDDLDAIPRMLARIDMGADVVAGSRYMAGGRIVGDTAKQRLSRYYSWLLRRVTSVGCHDLSNSFKAYRREVWTETNTKANSFDISVEVTLKALVLGYKIAEVPSVWTNRQAGKSQFQIRSELKNYGRWLLFAIRNTPRPNLWSRVISIGIFSLGIVALAKRCSRHPVP